jgi:hypothetical protein
MEAPKGEKELASQRRPGNDTSQHDDAAEQPERPAPHPALEQTLPAATHPEKRPRPVALAHHWLSIAPHAPQDSTTEFHPTAPALTPTAQKKPSAHAHAQHPTAQADPHPTGPQDAPTSPPTHQPTNTQNQASQAQHERHNRRHDGSPHQPITIRIHDRHCTAPTGPAQPVQHRRNTCSLRETGNPYSLWRAARRGVAGGCPGPAGGCVSACPIDTNTTLRAVSRPFVCAQGPHTTV